MRTMTTSAFRRTRFEPPTTAVNNLFIPAGMHVSTQEMATKTAADLELILHFWMLQSPTKLTPSRDQIADVRAVLGRCRMHILKGWEPAITRSPLKATNSWARILARVLLCTACRDLPVSV